MEQNTNPAPEQQPQNNQGFDINKVPKNSLISAGIAFLGLLSVFFAWSVWGNGFFRVAISGISSFGGFGVQWAGFLTLLAYAWIIVAILFGDMIKLDAKLKEMTIKFGAIIPLALGIIALIVISGKQGSIGFGLIINYLCGIALVLFGNNVIKLK